MKATSSLDTANNAIDAARQRWQRIYGIEMQGRNLADKPDTKKVKTLAESWREYKKRRDGK